MITSTTPGIKPTLSTSRITTPRQRPTSTQTPENSSILGNTGRPEEMMGHNSSTTTTTATFTATQILVRSAPPKITRTIVPASPGKQIQYKGSSGRLHKQPGEYLASMEFHQYNINEIAKQSAETRGLVPLNTNETISPEVEQILEKYPLFNAQEYNSRTDNAKQKITLKEVLLSCMKDIIITERIFSHTPEITREIIHELQEEFAQLTNLKKIADHALKKLETPPEYDLIKSHKYQTILLAILDEISQCTHLALTGQQQKLIQDTKNKLMNAGVYGYESLKISIVYNGTGMNITAAEFVEELKHSVTSLETGTTMILEGNTNEPDGNSNPLPENSLQEQDIIVSPREKHLLHIQHIPNVLWTVHNNHIIGDAESTLSPDQTQTETIVTTTPQIHRTTTQTKQVITTDRGAGSTLRQTPLEQVVVNCLQESNSNQSNFRQNVNNRIQQIVTALQGRLSLDELKLSDVHFTEFGSMTQVKYYLAVLIKTTKDIVDQDTVPEFVDQAEKLYLKPDKLSDRCFVKINKNHNEQTFEVIINEKKSIFRTIATSRVDGTTSTTTTTSVSSADVKKMPSFQPSAAPMAITTYPTTPTGSAAKPVQQPPHKQLSLFTRIRTTLAPLSKSTPATPLPTKPTKETNNDSSSDSSNNFFQI